jgi:DNA-binding SARP family transcriptional activator
VDSILLAWDDFSPLGSWFSWLEKWLRDNRDFPSMEIEARVATSSSGIVAWALPFRPDGKEWMEKALRLSRETGDISLQLQALSNCLMFILWMGDVEYMHIPVEQAKAIAHSQFASPLSLIVWKSAYGRARLFLPAEYGDSIDTIKEGIELAENSGIRGFDSVLYTLAGGGALSKGDVALAEEFARKLEAIAPRTPRGLSNQIQYLVGWIQFLRGNLDRALALAEKALQVAIECAIPFSEIVVRQLMAKILHAKGEYEAALRQVYMTKEIISRMGNSPLFTYFSLLDEAHFLFDAGEEKVAVEALRSAFLIGRAHNYKTLTDCWQPAVLASLCARALENDIETPYVQDLIRSLNLIPDSPPLDVKGWPWAIQIYTLGRFEIRRNGNAIEISRKAQRRPLDLLKALLAQGGQGVGESAIADNLWPESAGDVSHHAFEVTLQRLRTLLGYPQALQLRDGRLTLDPRYCWVDLWAFDHLLDRAKAEESSDRAYHAIRRATELYAGDFLAGESDKPWTEHMRERMKNRFLAALRRLGSYCEQSGKWQEALELYQKGLEVDDLSEELYRLLMTCYLRLGSKSEALSVYLNCKKNLSIFLGVAPSPETERLYRTIKQSH